jgi:hypothetical protein
VSTAGASSTSGNNRLLVLLLVVLGILAIIAGILYASGGANSIHVMVGSVHHGHHILRAAVSFVVGVVLLIGARYAARSR